MNVLNSAWHGHLRGTPEQFARFVGLGLDELASVSWERLSEVVAKRFDLQALGGGVRFPGSAIEDKTFSFRMPRCRKWWRIGVPSGGAQIDSSSEMSKTVNGRGKTADEAALSAVLALWELTWLRASQG